MSDTDSAAGGETDFVETGSEAGSEAGSVVSSETTSVAEKKIIGQPILDDIERADNKEALILTLDNKELVVFIDTRDKVTLIDNVAHVKGTVLSEDGKKFVRVQTLNLGECELEGSLGVNMDEIFFYDGKINDIVHALLSSTSLALTLEEFEELAEEMAASRAEAAKKEAEAAKKEADHEALITKLQQKITKLETNRAAGGGGATIDLDAGPEFTRGKNAAVLKSMKEHCAVTVTDEKLIGQSDKKFSGTDDNKREVMVIMASDAKAYSGTGKVEKDQKRRELMVRAKPAVIFYEANKGNSEHAAALSALSTDIMAKYAVGKDAMFKLLPDGVVVPSSYTRAMMTLVLKVWLFEDYVHNERDGAEQAA